MKRIIVILLVLLAFSDAPQVLASQAIGTHRFNLRWNGVNRGQPLPFARSLSSFFSSGRRSWNGYNRGLPLRLAGRSSPLVPVFPWVPTNSITFTTNRVMFPSTLHVLFLGNNITGAHNLDSVLTTMSQHGKQKISAKSYAPPGYTLFSHSVDVHSHTNISTSFPDFKNFTNRIPQHVIVLQEHTRAPVYTPGITLSSAQRLDVVVKSAKSQLAFLLPHVLGDQFFSTKQMYQKAEASIYGVAQQVNAPVIPAGLAWQLVEARHPEINLRDRGGFLPSQHGTYLNACMMYCALTWQSPLGLSNGGLHLVQSREARILQRTAWEVFVARRGAIPF